MKTVRMYEPDVYVKRGYALLFTEIAQDLIGNGWLTYQLFKREFLSLYKQSFLGIFWTVLVPVISIGTFLVLGYSGIVSTGQTAVPYPLYALTGMVFWQLFSMGLISGTSSLVKAGSMIIKINFSKKSLVIASFGTAVVSFLIQILFLIAVYAYYRIPLPLTVLLVPLALLPLVLFTVGLSFILALLNGIIRDIGNTIAVVMPFLMLLTPVLYEKPASGFLAKATAYNPLYYLISVPRELALNGTCTAVQGFLYSSIMAAGIFIVCLLIFHVAEKKIAERI